MPTFIEWSTGETMVDSIVVYPSETTTYTVFYQYPDNCEETVSQQITVAPKPIWNRKTVLKTPVPTDSLWCKSWADSTTVIKMNPDSLPPGSYTYEWSDGSTADSLIIQPDTSLEFNIYFVNIMSGDSCFRDSIRVRTVDCPCPGDPVMSPTIVATSSGRISSGYYGCKRTGSPDTLECPMPDTLLVNNVKLPLHHHHDGFDIGAQVGEKIHSMYAGTVVGLRKSFQPGQCALNSYGNYIIIRSSDNSTLFTIQYTHLREILVLKNQKIKRGQVIAIAGKTGNACRVPNPHTHIRVSIGSNFTPLTLVNPDSYFSTKFDFLFNPIPNSCS